MFLQEIHLKFSIGHGIVESPLGLGRSELEPCEERVSEVWLMLVTFLTMAVTAHLNGLRLDCKRGREARPRD